MAVKYHIGCQSWGYDDWITPVGGSTVFYPRGTKKAEMLGLYSRVLPTIEVDATLYGVPPETTYQGWFDETPDDFIFSLKFPREITHDKALRGDSVKLMNEFVDRSTILRHKLGMFLIQFPASFEATKDDAHALREFLKHLPSGRSFAVEFRHESWFVDWMFEVLEAAGVALCLCEGKWVDRAVVIDAADKVTSADRYIRFMGERDLPRFDRIYRHRDDVLAMWKPVIESLPAENIYIYSDNYFEGFAPGTANKLERLFGLPVSDPAGLETQGSLF